MSAHYSIGSEIKSMDDLRAIFPTGKAGEMNWCLLSTSGVHGDYQTLDEAGRVEDDGYVLPQEVTVLVIQPRLVCMRCGLSPTSSSHPRWLRLLHRRQGIPRLPMLPLDHYTGGAYQVAEQLLERSPTLIVEAAIDRLIAKGHRVFALVPQIPWPPSGGS